MSERSDIPKSWQALPWLSEVKARGGSSYAVGGAVRDWLRAEPAVDLDLVVRGVGRDDLSRLLSRHGRVDDVGASFAVLKWRPRGGGPEVDVALPRVERSTGPGHRDLEVEASESIGIEADLARLVFVLRIGQADNVPVDEYDETGGAIALVDRAFLDDVVPGMGRRDTSILTFVGFRRSCNYHVITL